MMKKLKKQRAREEVHVERGPKRSRRMRKQVDWYRDIFQNPHHENHSVWLIVLIVYGIHQWFRPPAVRLVEISGLDTVYSSQAQNTFSSSSPT